MPDVLVLSHTFEPIDIVDWERAVVLDYEGKTETVEVYLGKFLRSPSLTIEMPAVIRFKTPHKKRRQVVRFSREAVYDRDNGLCGYCGQHVSIAAMTYDHVIPRMAGGLTKWDNVTTACQACNTRKGGRTPEQAGMHLRMAPVKPKSLSGKTRRSRLTWHEGMPKEWRPWLKS
jgi:5-methylcytosine-specific restriction endonuclease McrA